jgi:hypothetical protein
MILANTAPPPGTTATRKWSLIDGINPRQYLREVVPLRGGQPGRGRAGCDPGPQQCPPPDAYRPVRATERIPQQCPQHALTTG